MRTYNEKLATNVVLSANRTSSFAPLKNIILYSIAAVITGTPTGTIKLQACNDPETNDTSPLPNAQSNPVNWVDIADSSFPLTTAGETMWNVRDIGYNYVRVVYTDSSGGTSTAVMNIVFNGKGI
jgi:hypothetical protein